MVWRGTSIDTAEAIVFTGKDCTVQYCIIGSVAALLFLRLRWRQESGGGGSTTGVRSRGCRFPGVPVRECTAFAEVCRGPWHGALPHCHMQIRHKSVKETNRRLPLSEPTITKYSVLTEKIHTKLVS
jgi:hypothetical protein